MDENKEMQGGQPEDLFGGPEENVLDARTKAIQAQVDVGYGDESAEPQYDYEEEYEDEDDDDYDEYAASRKAGKGCLIGILVLLIAVAVAALIGYNWYRGEIGGKHATVSEAAIVEIGSGNSTRTIGEKLEEAGVIGNATVFRLYVKYLYDGDTNYQVGSFEIEPGMGYDAIVQLLNEQPNAMVTMNLTIIEGTTVMALADTFVKAGLVDNVDEFLMVADDLERFSDIPFIARLLEDFEEPVFHASEGYLYPSTYEFYVDDEIENYVRRLYLEMDKRFTEEVYARMEELGLSVRELITFASLVQQEAGSDPSQQPYVAQVIWNRLGDGWAQNTLGLDVTLRYVRQYMQWNDDYYITVDRSSITYPEARDFVGEDLFYAYVTEDSDVGRSREGLPTGPISSVMDSAIQAVLYPESAEEGKNFYYFLTTLKGNYYYAETYPEHQVNEGIMRAENAEVAAEAEQEEENAG